jgi:hypothetical protein
MKLALFFAGALALFAQQPHVSNARLETRPVTGGLEAAFQSILRAQASPAWGPPPKTERGDDGDDGQKNYNLRLAGRVPTVSNTTLNGVAFTFRCFGGAVWPLEVQMNRQFEADARFALDAGATLNDRCDHFLYPFCQERMTSASTKIFFGPYA